MNGYLFIVGCTLFVALLAVIGYMLGLLPDDDEWRD